MARQGLELKHKRDYHWVFVVLWLLLFVCLAAIGWIGYRYFTTGELPPVLSVGALKANSSVDETAIGSGQIASHTVAADEPRYISIPSLGIDKARIFKTGVDSNNQLVFPGNLNDVGWYHKSTSPGTGYGVALLTGHNEGVSKKGVFAKISTLRAGTELTIERGDGQTTAYVVGKIQEMSIEEASKTGMKTMLEPLDSSKEGLTLVTTSGNWVPRIKQFAQRTIVRAVATE